MFWLNGLAALFVVAIFHSGPSEALKSDMRTITKNWRALNSKQFFPTHKFHDRAEDPTSFIYLSCEPLKSNQSVSCNVTRTSPYLERIPSTICKDLRLNVKTREPFPEWNRYMVYYYLDSNRILIQWVVTDNLPFGEYVEEKNTSEMKYRIIDTGNCSTISELSIYVNATGLLLDTNPIVYSDTFEIVTFLEENCRGMSGCRKTYDFDGKLIGDIQPFVSNAESRIAIIPADEYSVDKGHYVIGVNFPSLGSKEDDTLILEKVDSSDGKPREIMRIPVKTQISNPLRMVHSNAHDRFGICWLGHRGSKSARCLQLYDNNITLNVEFEIPKNTIWIAVRNLAGGGFLTITGACDLLQSILRCKGHRIQRITADGHLQEALESAVLELTELKESLTYDLSITENNSGEFLFSYSSSVENATSQTDSLLLHRAWINKMHIP